MRPYSPGGILNALAAAQGGSIPPTPSIHRLGLGLPGYLIPFAPPAFAPQRQDCPRRLPSPWVFLPISTHFTATPVIPSPPSIFKTASIHRPSGVEPRAFTADLATRLRALYAVTSDNARPLRITAAAGTELAGAYSTSTVIFFLLVKRSLQPEGLPPPRGVAASGFPPLRKIPNCCPP